MTRIFTIVLLDVGVISLLIWLVVIHVVPLYPTAPIVIPMLFVANFLMIWRAAGGRVNRQAKGIRVSKIVYKLVWFGVAAFTIDCIVQIAYWVRQPDIRSTTQAIIGVLLAAYAWFLVRYLSPANKNE